MSATGRPSKFTDVAQQVFCAALLAGATYRTAAEVAGLDYSTFRRWMRRARRGDKRYTAFAQAVRTANTRVQMRLHRIVFDAAATDWRAAAWLLERRWPEEYGKCGVCPWRFIREMSDEQLVAHVAGETGEGELPEANGPLALPEPTDAA